MLVRELTTEQKDLIINQMWGDHNQIFNPVQDADGKWYISEEEVQGCVTGCAWLHELPQIEYKPITS